MNYHAFLDELEKIASAAAKPALRAVRSQMGDIMRRMTKLKSATKPLPKPIPPK